MKRHMDTHPKAAMRELFMRWLPLVLVVAVHFLFLYKVDMRTGDFEAYRKQLEVRGLWAFTVLHYTTWSSRTLIEAVLVLMCQSLPLFALFDCAVTACIFYCLQVMFNPRGDQARSWLVAFGMLCYSPGDLLGAGIIPASLNYTWPMTTLLYLLVCQTRILRGEQLSKPQFAAAVAAAIFAANNELLAIVCLCSGALLLVLQLLGKRPWKLSAAQIVVAVLWLIYVATCPGNAQRLAQEMTRIPGFESFSLLDKTYLGFVSTFNHYLLSRNIIFLLFGAFLAVSAWESLRPLWQRAVGMVPLVTELCALCVAPSLLKDLPMLGHFFYRLDLQAGQRGLSSPLLEACVFACIILTLVFLYEDSLTDVFLNLAIFVGGFGTRLAMGFSPTLFASGLRTYTFMDFSLIMLILFACLRLRWFEKQGTRSFMLGMCCFAACMSVTSLLM